MGGEIKNIGLVLSGGFASGAIQLAFANEIIKKNGRDKIKIISASSIGTINVLSISTNSIDHLLSFYKNQDYDWIKEFRISLKNRLFKTTYNVVVDKNISVPFYTSAMRLPQLSTYYFYSDNNTNRKLLRKIINSSMAFPFINEPRRGGGGYVFIDGGSGDNVPVYPLLDYKDLDMILILHLYPRYCPSEFDVLKCKENNIILLDCDVSLNAKKKYSSFDLFRDSFEEMVSSGTKNGQEFADEIFSNLDKDEILNRANGYIRKTCKKRKTRGRDNLLSFVESINFLYNLKEPEG